MTISSTANRNDYTGNDTTDTYNYSFRVFLNTDFIITVRNTTTDVETTLVLTTDYTVTGVGAAAGGTIVLAGSGKAWQGTGAFLDTGYVMTIRRVVGLTQGTDIRNQGDFFPEVHEDVFDKALMIDQQQQDDIDRSAKLPETIAASDFDATLPADIVGEDSLTIMTDPTGTSLVAGPSASAISGASTSAAAAAASAAAASTSETNAATSETNAGTSETNAATSASNASTSETNAGTSETNAATSETNAGTSETNAATSETNAATSETNAATSASNASTSETNAGTSETNAGTSETNAATSETNAGTSETNAAASAATALAATSKYLTYANVAAYESANGAAEDGDVFYDSTLNVVRTYESTAWHDEVLTDVAQTFTNKTFDDEIRMKEISTPGSAASGYQDLFVDSADNKVKKINSSGEVSSLGGGAASDSLIKLYRAFDDGDTDFTIKSIDDILPDFGGSDTLTATFSVPSSGSEAFLSEDDDHKIYKFATTTASQYDAVGFTLGLPRGFRGRSLVFQVDYRTGDTSGASANADYMPWIWDKTNGANTTTTSTGSQVAGTSLTVGDSSDMAVGNKIWVGETGGTSQVTEAHITAIADSTHVTISEDVNLTSGDRFVTGVRTDVLTTFDAADSDTDKEASQFKVVFTPPADCAELVVMFQQLTSETDSFLYFDNVLISSEVTKRVFARGQSESCKFRGVAGYGSTNTVIPYYTNEDRNTIASHATVANDLTSGFSLTAKKKVRVVGSITHNVDSGGADYYVGWTVNSNQLTTAVISLTDQSTVEHQEYFRDNGINSSTTTTIPVDVILNKGDVLRPHGDGVAVGAFASYCSLTLTATPEVNDVVIVESTEVVRNSHGAYITNDGATATLVSKSSNWITSVSRTSGGQVAVDWTILGLSQPPASITVTPRGYTGNQFLMVDAVTATGCDVRGDSDGGSNTDLDFNLSIEVHEDDAKDYDPLLAFPTITYGQEAEEYKATDWAGNGTGNLALPYFNNVQVNTVSNLGTVTNDSTEGCYFTATERCKVDGTVWLCSTGNMYVGFSVNSDATQRDADIAAITDESVTLGYHHQSTNAVPSIYSVSEILNAGDVLYAHGISSRTPEATAARSGVKFVATPIHGVQNHAAIIAQPVAFVEDRKANGTVGGSGSLTPANRDLTTVSGDIAAVDISTNGTDNFTLNSAGKYLIEWQAPFGRVGHATTALHDGTDYIKRGNSAYNGPTSDNYSILSTGQALVTITSATSYTIKYEIASTISGEDLGIETNNHLTIGQNYELYTQVKITRMK